SSGANLAAAVTLWARDHGAPELAFQLLIYPPTDNSAARHRHHSRIENATGYRLSTESLEWFRAHYLAADGDGENPGASTLLAEALHGLPPACIVTAEFDPLRDEGEAYGAALERAGVPVLTYRASGMIHGFFNLDAILEGARIAQAVAFGELRRVLVDERA